jgi:sugar lactone lactonase YvrE
MKIEVITNHKCSLGEGPVWDAEHQAIYWIDIVKGEIHEFCDRTHSYSTYSINEMIGCFALCKNGQLVIATQSGFGFLDRTTGAIEMVANPESHSPNNRFNDGKCDPFGRFWAGTMSLSEEPNVGNMYVFENKTVEKRIENVTISNGLAWSLDHKTLYYIDTPTFEVVAYNYEKETGVISNRQVVLNISKEDGFPDGMTIDTEGCLWIAHWDGGQVTRWNPKTGEKLDAIKLPVSRITACTFGGKDLNDLFITSASIGLSEDELKEQPLAGSLFVIRNCGFHGTQTFEFNN